MDKILSQEEVNALLKGIEEGEVPTSPSEEDTASKSEPRKYDLTTRDRVIRGRMPTLEIINERFARMFQVTLSGMLKEMVDITLQYVEIKKFGEFIQKIPLPASINIFRMDPLKGFNLFVIDPRIVYLLIDNFFGGKGQTHVKIEGRDFTPIEQRVIGKIVDLAFHDLEKAWAPVHQIKISLNRREVNPQFATIVTSTEAVAVVEFNVEMNDVPGKMFICIPYPNIEPIKEKLQAGYQSDQYDVDNKWYERLRSNILECSVHVRVELGESTLRVKDVLNLNTGDIILLNKAMDENIIARVEGVPKFLGRPGIYKGSIAFQILSTVK